MRLPRMTTRRWMIAVAVVALLMGGIVGAVRLKHRRDSFRPLAQAHEEMATDFERLTVVLHTLDGLFRGTSRTPPS